MEKPEIKIRPFNQELELIIFLWAKSFERRFKCNMKEAHEMVANEVDGYIDDAIDLPWEMTRKEIEDISVACRAATHGAYELFPFPADE